MMLVNFVNVPIEEQYSEHGKVLTRNWSHVIDIEVAFKK